MNNFKYSVGQDVVFLDTEGREHKGTITKISSDNLYYSISNNNSLLIIKHHEITSLI